ncbi:MAG TPA: hypothetical protein VFH88_10680 [Candidatus Krumholzibacteria bacterium]|nr:hypothetical protein [Candidatus Krumholzibacteria bacterium]
MKVNACRVGAAALAAASLLFLYPRVAGAQAPDSLTLKPPTGVKAWSVYNPGSRKFLVWIRWRDLPDDIATFISPVDTTGWSVGSLPSEMSIPTVGGSYHGDIDRTIAMHAIRSGVVGVDELIVTFEVRREEYISGRVTIDASYKPGTVLPMDFRDQHTGKAVPLGLNIKFSAGRMDLNGTCIAGVEDFEGFHIWRGIKDDGSDLQVIGEISKEEAALGRKTGGSLADSLYFYEVVPTLRSHMAWISNFGAVDCLGTRIDLDLDSNELFWWDCDGTNGFTYYYAITTFDRSYSVKSGLQGLSKHDHCPVEGGVPYPCKNEMVPVRLEASPQSDLYNVYVVPNPVRTGSSRLTTDNYHNFPDGLCRFVNVPAHCTIKIYTVAGDLVWANDHQDGTGNVEWDTRNFEEQEVASGVYVYRIENGSDSVYGRIVVIR